jgi:hypothetical protein
MTSKFDIGDYVSVGYAFEDVYRGIVTKTLVRDDGIVLLWITEWSGRGCDGLKRCPDPGLVRVLAKMGT